MNANILNLNVNGDFDYTQRGIINNTSLTLEVGGDFSNNDATTGFVWEESDTLTVSGNLLILLLLILSITAVLMLLTLDLLALLKLQQVTQLSTKALLFLIF